MYTHFRGTVFQFAGQLQDDGVVQDLTDAVVAASVFDPGGTILYGALTVTYIDRPTGLIQVGYPDTSAWPVGKARVDFTLTTALGELIAAPPDVFRVAQTPMIG